MKSFSFSTFTRITGAILVASAITIHADFIQPVAVQASNGEATQESLINGFGFDFPEIGAPDALHVPFDSEMWSVAGSIRADAIFDLGERVDLTKVYVWNYNAPDNTDRGMKEVEVLVSSDADMDSANFTGIALISLTEGGEAGQAFDVVGTDVRLVKLKGISNWGHGWSVGLAEVRFESGNITGAVPSIVIDTPHEGDVIPSGTEITLEATIRDGDNDILNVEFFDGPTKLDETARRPYSTVIPTPSTGNHAFRVVVTDQSGKVAWSTVELSVRELVADRIEQIDDTTDEGESLNQVFYSEGWTLAQGNENDPRFNNNDHYSNVRNSFIEVKFTGVKIDVFATVASHHGSGVATIDGGTEYEISYKATQRAEQAFVWSSPILLNREHVLRIEVSGNGVVTVDRFDVHVSDTIDQERAVIKKVTPSAATLTVELEDAGASVVDPASVSLSVDGTTVTASVVKSPPTTTITYSPATAFSPGSSHTVSIAATDSSGTVLTLEAPFDLPKPPFPLSGLGGPFSTAGQWGFRQIWNAGRADALVTAVEIALSANEPGFTGSIDDTSLQFIDHGESMNPGVDGVIPGSLALPAETEGLSENDFVIVARAKVRIPRSGDWTIGVHTDEGFALRFIGASFSSVFGNGILDENFPEYIAFETNTGDSNTRGVLEGITAGDYEIEFISWERVGTSAYEIYAAEGILEEDDWTFDWFLIGELGGLQIIASGPKLATTGISLTGNGVSIDFVSPTPDGQHQLQESTDLENWTRVTSATFSKSGTYGVRASVNSVTGSAKFYRVVLNAP